MSVKEDSVVVVTPEQFREICDTRENFSLLDNKQTTNEFVQWKRTFWKNGVLYVEDVE